MAISFLLSALSARDSFDVGIPDVCVKERLISFFDGVVRLLTSFLE